MAAKRKRARRRPAAAARVLATGASGSAFLAMLVGFGYASGAPNTKPASAGVDGSVRLPATSLAPTTVEAPATPPTVVMQEIHWTIYGDEQGSPVPAPTNVPKPTAPVGSPVQPELASIAATDGGSPPPPPTATDPPATKRKPGQSGGPAAGAPTGSATVVPVVPPAPAAEAPAAPPAPAPAAPPPPADEPAPSPEPTPAPPPPPPVTQPPVTQSPTPPPPPPTCQGSQCP